MIDTKALKQKILDLAIRGKQAQVSLFVYPVGKSDYQDF